ncbi:MAG: hypothetical protein QM831_17405 [Kofleriaceae bacterium]
MKKLLVVAGVAGMAVGGWKLSHRHHTDGGGTVTNQLWLDHMPKNDRDLTHVLIALHDKDPRGDVGILNYGSAWRANINIFKFEKSGDSLRVLFPQNGFKAQWTTKVSHCSVDQFTLCLEVTAPRGTFRYFSRDEWVIDSADAGRALEQKILHDAPVAPADFVPTTTADLAE